MSESKIFNFLKARETLIQLSSHGRGGTFFHPGKQGSTHSQAGWQAGWRKNVEKMAISALNLVPQFFYEIIN